MAAIMEGTYFGATGASSSTVPGAVAIGYIEWRPAGKAGAASPKGASIVTLKAPDTTGRFVNGKKVTVATNAGTFSGTITGGSANPKSGTPAVFLDNGVNYTKSVKITGGTIYPTPAATPVAKVAEVAKKNWMPWLIGGLVVAGLLWWKFGKKGKK